MSQERSIPSNAASGVFSTPDGKTVEIRDVWASNLDEEMEIIRELIEKYHYIAMVSRGNHISVPCLMYFDTFDART